MSQSDKIAMLTGGSAPDVGVPAYTDTDGAVGVRTAPTPGESATAFPAAIALAAGFDPTLAEAYGSAVGVEARAHGADIDWGPTVNIMRTPLGGRTYEAYGEDPFLQGVMATGWIKGLQSQGVMASIKHFIEDDQEGQLGVSPLVGLNGGRTFVNVIVDQRTLHEIDLRPFAMAIATAKPALVMCSYNQINGQFGCDNPYDLQTVLRKQLGFQGIIVSDFLVASHTPWADLNAGMDVGNADTESAPAVELALLDGSVSQQTLDARVHEYLRTLFAYGFFDRAAYVNNPSTVDQAHSDAVATSTEENGATLLKNDGVLPLTGTHKKILVVGMPADSYVFGFGSSQVTPDQTPVTVLDGIEARAAEAGDTVVYDDGSDLAQTEADAKTADAVIVVAADSETEGSDKQCMSLTPQCAPTVISTLAVNSPTDDQLAWGDQDALISAVEQANPRTIVVLETGAPVLTPWRSGLGALLEAWYPGQTGGTAIAHVLWGDADPGGRLPATFPASYAQEPTAGSTSCYPGIPSGTVQTSAGSAALYTETICEGVFPGYRWFDAHHETPAYPFGYGISYTTFAYSHLQIHGHSVELTVTNTGHRTGTAVPEVYLGLPSTAAVPEPPEQLAGFDKLSLAPGAKATVTIPLPERSFQYWNTPAADWSVMPGCVNVLAGSSSDPNDLPLAGVIAQGGARCASSGCPSPPGRLSGRTLGPITLGENRSQAGRGLLRTPERRSPYVENFCFDPVGIRVGFPPPRAAARLRGSVRLATAGRVVIILSANPYYRLHRIRPGSTVASAQRLARLSAPIHARANTWYLIRMPGASGVLKTHDGVVEEVGIADRRLTTPRSLAVAFLSSF
jgi:beta-glucosidase